MKCPNCNKDNTENAKFCTKCGSALSDKIENQDNLQENNNQDSKNQQTPEHIDSTDQMSPVEQQEHNNKVKAQEHYPEYSQDYNVAASNSFQADNSYQQQPQQQAFQTNPPMAGATVSMMAPNINANNFNGVVPPKKSKGYSAIFIILISVCAFALVLLCLFCYLQTQKDPHVEAIIDFTHTASIEENRDNSISDNSITETVKPAITSSSSSSSSSVPDTYNGKKVYSGTVYAGKASDIISYLGKKLTPNSPEYTEYDAYLKLDSPITVSAYSYGTNTQKTKTVNDIRLGICSVSGGKSPDYKVTKWIPYNGQHIYIATDLTKGAYPSDAPCIVPDVIANESDVEIVPVN